LQNCLFIISTCSSHTFFQARTVLQQILGSGLMHWQEGFPCLKDSIILQMQNILITRNFLFLFMVLSSSEIGCCRCSVCAFLNEFNIILLNNSTAQQMQRNYSTFIMLKHAISLSVFLKFSNNASGFYFSLLIIPLTFNLVFLLQYVLSRISFKKLTPRKAQYLQIYTNQLTHPCLLKLTMTMIVVSLLRITTMEIQRSRCTG
jgi:hypothetical protein